jgi:hypothetical protein
MGFLDRLKNIAQSQDLPPFELQFDSTFEDQLNSIPRGTKSITLNFDETLLKEIDEAIDGHQASPRVPYDEEMQFLEVVGESYHQTELKELFDQFQEEWLSGLLIPEPYNPFDAKAVMVVIINPDDFSTVQCGHLAKDQAAKVQAKILKLLAMDAYVPVLLKLTGGTPDKPHIGVLARAKTKKIKF